MIATRNMYDGERKRVASSLLLKERGLLILGGSSPFRKSVNVGSKGFQKKKLQGKKKTTGVEGRESLETSRIEKGGTDTAGDPLSNRGGECKRKKVYPILRH